MKIQRLALRLVLVCSAHFGGIGLAHAATDGANCISPQLAKLGVGFVLTHESVNTKTDAECATSPSGGATVEGKHNIVKQYNDPETRRSVRKMLETMHTQDATVMRTIIWYRHAEDAAMSNRPTDPLGLLVATNGKLPEEQVKNIVGYVTDAKSIGYKRFIIVLGPQGTSNPKCKRLKWGDCYNQEYLNLTWSVTDQVVRALQLPSLSGIDVVFDISPEACFPPSPKELVDRNLESYSRYMIRNYRDTLGDQQFISSCGAGKADRAILGLSGQQRMFNELHVRPSSIDIHVYDTDAAKVKKLLINADRVARELQVPLDIHETYYDHPNIFSTVSELLSSEELTSLREILVFPRRNKSPCQIDIAPPYSMGTVNKHLKRYSDAGSPLEVCFRER